MRPVTALDLYGFDRAVLGGESVPQAVIDKQGLDEANRAVDLLTERIRKAEGKKDQDEVAKLQRRSATNSKPA